MKTVICPKCGKAIDSLNFSSKVPHYGTLKNDELYTKEYGDWEDEEYACPECDSVLFTDNTEANLFLEGEGQ